MDPQRLHPHLRGLEAVVQQHLGPGERHPVLANEVHVLEVTTRLVHRHSGTIDDHIGIGGDIFQEAERPQCIFSQVGVRGSSVE